MSRSVDGSALASSSVAIEHDATVSNLKPQEAAGRGVSRRGLLRRLTPVGALAGFWSATAEPPAARASEVSADTDPGSLLPKLVRHATMGFKVSDFQLAQSLGYQGYLEYQLNYTAIPESASLTTRLASLTTLTMTYLQMRALNNEGLVRNELIEAAILRAVFSTRQLFERMVEFWTDHLNIDVNTNELYKSIDDRDVVRRHALSTFPQLLTASAMSPAMLFYLDNTSSVVGNINENYARELMELHTMGVDGGYTQQDVEEVARCFTGWGVYPNNDTQGLAGQFRYNASQHDNGSKIVLGNIIPANGGMQDGMTVLNILIDHPSTARFIARKLTKWLLGYEPAQSVIDAVAAVYTSTRGDIKAMVRAALAPNHLYDAEPKYKRPFHLMVSTMRAMPTTINSTSSLRTQLRNMGHLTFYWPSPDGYPDKFDHWSGLILPRWNFGASLLNGSVSGVTVDTTAFFSGLTTADQMADRINEQIFGGEMPSAERLRIRDYLLPNTPSLTRQREALGLAVAAPSFQWY